MAWNQPAKIHRGVEFERMATQRCTSPEAAQVLQNFFDREYAARCRAQNRKKENASVQGHLTEDRARNKA